MNKSKEVDNILNACLESLLIKGETASIDEWLFN